MEENMSLSNAKLPGTDCVEVTYVRVTICSFGAFPVCYSVNEGTLLLTGKTPRDNSWDGKKVKIYGHLVAEHGCTMLFVEKAVVC